MAGRQRCLKFDLRYTTGGPITVAIPGCADLHRHYQFLRIFQRWIARDPDALVRSYEEHLLIFQAVCDADRAQACDALRTHIRESARLVQEMMKRQESS